MHGQNEISPVISLQQVGLFEHLNISWWQCAKNTPGEIYQKSLFFFFFLLAVSNSVKLPEPLINWERRINWGSTYLISLSRNFALSFCQDIRNNFLNGLISKLSLVISSSKIAAFSFTNSEVIPFSGRVKYTPLQYFEPSWRLYGKCDLSLQVNFLE